MKISHPQLTSALQNYKKTADVKKEQQEGNSTVKAQDKSQISNQGKLYQAAAKALREGSPAQEERVEAVKKQVEAGTYSVSGREIAEKIVTKGIDEII